jgi:GNAT superfamily N-acetyltransferase
MPQMLANARKFIDKTPYKDFPYDEESMRDEFLSMMECGLCVIAEVDGIHVGGVGAVKAPLFLNKKTFVAGERFWWVVPDDRARGVGKALLKEIHVAAKKAGCDYLMMLSLADPTIDQIYLGLGFTEVEHSFMKRL